MRPFLGLHPSLKVPLPKGWQSTPLPEAIAGCVPFWDEKSMQTRVGIGYDIHRLVSDRKLFLGGVEIPYVKGLFGHSDADVLIHAICDALLGAASLGDIGEYFPDTGPQYRDIASSALLKQVVLLLKKHNFVISNIDTVVITEEPKLSPFKSAMRESLALLLRIKPAQVGIKAKTSEGLGEVGQKKAIEAYAVALITKGGR